MYITLYTVVYSTLYIAPTVHYSVQYTVVYSTLHTALTLYCTEDHLELQDGMEFGPNATWTNYPKTKQVPEHWSSSAMRILNIEALVTSC